jgi:predicted DCC family thiol-disulfide oxidoreductase YuxK
VVFLYDGDCAFCSSCARWLRRWVPTTVTVLPWQFADAGALGVTAAECDAAVQWIDGARRASGPAAIAALLRTSHVGWRGVGRLLGTRVGLALTWPVYRWVARNRDRMPGATATCALPSGQRLRPGIDQGR